MAVNAARASRAQRFPSARRRPRWHLRVAAALAILAVAVLTGACSIRVVQGEGPVVTETRQVAAFSQIEADHGIDIDVRVGPTQSVEVHAQQNLQSVVSTTVNGETLRITGNAEFFTEPRPQVVIVVPSLGAIDISGGSQGVVEQLAGQHLGLRVSGGSGIRITGTVDTLSVEGSGGGSAQLRDLLVRAASVDLSGGTLVTVHASEVVTGDLNGGAQLTVLGDPEIQVDAGFGGVVQRG